MSWSIGCITDITLARKKMTFTFFILGMLLWDIQLSIKEESHFCMLKFISHFLTFLQVIHAFFFNHRTQAKTLHFWNIVDWLICQSLIMTAFQTHPYFLQQAMLLNLYLAFCHCMLLLWKQEFYLKYPKKKSRSVNIKNIF